MWELVARKKEDWVFDHKLISSIQRTESTENNIARLVSVELMQQKLKLLRIICFFKLKCEKKMF
jgi:hypothetical protein